MKIAINRIVHYTIASLLALVLLYVTSSGPVLRFGYRDKVRYVPVNGFYAPLFSGAKTLHLLLPLGLYLRAWGVIVGINSYDGQMLIVSESYLRKMQEQKAATPVPKAGNSSPP